MKKHGSEVGDMEVLKSAAPARKSDEIGGLAEDRSIHNAGLIK